ncbi:MAG: hypothetical protein WBL44_17950 [Nitrososphaeraceae archaeon]
MKRSKVVGTRLISVEEGIAKIEATISQEVILKPNMDGCDKSCNILECTAK